MASRVEIEQALVAADRAGDTQAAAALAAELRALIQPAPTADQRMLASAPMRVLKGAKDPIDAGAQVLSRVPGAGYVNTATQYVNELPVIGPVTKALGMVPATSQQIDSDIASTEKEYQSARRAVAGGDPGMDIARFVGNVVSPVNLGIAASLPMRGGSLMLKGAAAGGAGGLLAPVEDTTQGFWGPKAVQIGTGAAVGAVAAPLMQKIAESVSSKIAAFRNSPQRADVSAAQLLKDALERNNLQAGDIPESALKAMQDEIAASLRSGRPVDPGQFVRQKAAETIDVKLTKGQLTRDPMQFAKERNLRGVEGVGKPLTDRLVEQNARLQDVIGSKGGRSALDETAAGTKLAAALRQYDEGVKARVSQAYELARGTEGRYANLDVKAFSEAANNALDERQLGRVLPEKAREMLNDISTGKTPLDVNTAVQIDSVLSDIGRSADNAGKKAIGVVRAALNNAPIEGELGVESKAAFDAARRLARSRFAQHEAIPALEAVAEGSASPDSFVRKFLVNEDSNRVRALAKLLRQTDPAAFEEAKSQIGAYVQRAAFGENISGDKVFSPERYAQVLRSLGPSRLSAFFTGNEQAELAAANVVGSAINSIPAASAVNTSNTAGALGNFMRGTGGFLRNVPVVRGTLDAAGIGRDIVSVRDALSAQAAQRAPALTAEMRRRLAYALTAGSAAAGAAGAPDF